MGLKLGSGISLVFLEVEYMTAISENFFFDSCKWGLWCSLNILYMLWSMFLSSLLNLHFAPIFGWACTVKKGAFIHMFRYSTLGCCSGFYGNISVSKLGFHGNGLIPVLTYWLLPWLFCSANTVVDTFPLNPLFHIHGYHGNYCSNPGCYI